MFQQKLNEVVPVVGARHMPWGEVLARRSPAPPSLTSEMVSKGCSGVKGGLVFHRSPNAYNPPDGSAHRRISYSISEAHTAVWGGYDGPSVH